MGEIFLKVIERSAKHENTAREYSREVEYNRVFYILEKISKSIPEDKICYIFGMGKHPKSTYSDLKTMPGIEVVWFGSLLPKYLWPLRIVMASYEGLIKIVNTDRIKDVFEILSRMSMVGLYVFDNKLQDPFIDVVKTKKYSDYADEVVKDDKGYFIYKIDADSLESTTGIFEIVSYGRDCSKELTGIINLG